MSELPKFVKTPIMRELTISYYDEFGNERTETHYIPEEVYDYITELLVDVYELEREKEYWKNLFEMHITRGIIQN
jgi:hypothetical protein